MLIEGEKDEAGRIGGGGDCSGNVPFAFIPASSPVNSFTNGIQKEYLREMK